MTPPADTCEPRLTPKQREVVNYMRGNGCALGREGWLALLRRGVWTNRGISQVISALVDKGLVEVDTQPFAPNPRERLTPAGRRVQ